MLASERFTGMPELELSERESGAIRYLEHGFPHWRVRWHYHDEYELHYICATSGKMFIGDFVGAFEPGTLILTGPRLPHNWISQLPPGEHCALRDQVVHFDHGVMMDAINLLPELRSLLPLLKWAANGVEFFRLEQAAEQAMQQIRETKGATRLSHFLEFMDRLAHNKRRRLLSTLQIQLPVDESLPSKIDRVVNYVLEHYHEKLTVSDAASLLAMSQGHFTRTFVRATGNTFTDFVNRLRVGRACELLANSDAPVTSICGEVGFNNVANFNRRFRQYKNMTPRAYRNAARQRYISSSTEAVSPVH